VLQRAQDNNGNVSAYQKTIATREIITKVQTIAVAHKGPGKYRDDKN